MKIISDKPYVAAYKFNNFGEFLTEEGPAQILEILDSYRAEANPDMILTSQEDKKRILIENKSTGLKLSLKFFKVGSEEEGERLKMRFMKKAG